MTSQEIKNYIRDRQPTVDNRPLWEIAYQLAVLVEQHDGVWQSRVEETAPDYTQPVRETKP